MILKILHHPAAHVEISDQFPCTYYATLVPKDDLAMNIHTNIKSLTNAMIREQFHHPMGLQVMTPSEHCSWEQVLSRKLFRALFRTNR